jgi:hypothetical protein
MRQLVAVLALLWALGNLLVAYLFLTSGVAAKNVHKGLGVQASLIVGGLLLALFAMILVVQSLSLATSRQKETSSVE